MITRPMLAETIENIEELKFPLVASAKLDGIRCLKINGKAVSRKFKPIPNHFVRNWIETHLPDGIDGELMLIGKSFNNIQSEIMSEDGEPDFEFYAFDYVKDGLDKPFSQRYEDLIDWANSHPPETVVHDRLSIVSQRECYTTKDLLNYEEHCLNLGYEGVMTRDPEGGYKCGRSTLKQAWLLKLKRFKDSEAEVLGFEELQTNTNEKEVNELGLSKRSTKKAGKVGAGILGKFHVRDIHTGLEFDLGAGEGLTKDLRKQIWDIRDQYLGKLVKYKYQAAGQKDLPRFPVWLGFRDERDL